MIYYCVFFHKKKLVRLTLRQDLIPLSFIPHTGPLVALKVLPPNAPHSHQIRLVAFGMMLPDNLKMHSRFLYLNSNSRKPNALPILWLAQP